MNEICNFSLDSAIGFAQLQAVAKEAVAKAAELAEQEELARLGTQIELPDTMPFAVLRT